MARLLFVDDHPLYRSGVERTLADAMPELDLVLAACADEALASLERCSDVDLCLTDLRLPGEDGLSLLQRVGARWPTVARGLLCGDPTPDVARRAKDLGCVACLSKARDLDALVDALATLFQGGTLFDTTPGLIADGGLSDKRRVVLSLAARGWSNKQIARELGISERTVKDHWAHIFHRLTVGNRAEAVSRAHQMQLI